ncbi:replication-relaxation family protein [Nocardiopsis composta]
MAAEHGRTAREWGYRRDQVLSVAYRSSLTHTIGTNAFFVDLQSHSRARHDVRLIWRTSAECMAQFDDVVRPDGAGQWEHRNEQVAFFLEYDTGTEPLRRLADKLDRYHELSRLTGHRGVVLFYLPSPTRQDNLHRYLGKHAPPVPAATAVHAAHPAEQVWTPIGSSRHYTLAGLGALTEPVEQPFLPEWDDPEEGAGG